MTAPSVSVIVAAYASHPTIAAALQALAAQTWRDAEVIVVDSSPDDRTASAVRRFPHTRLVRSAERLTPHEARNLGVRHARGACFIFTDADIIPEPHWVERLMTAYQATGEVIVGALACHGERYFDNAVHLCKFSRFLSGGPPRPIDVGPTGNLLVPRPVYEAVGGFPPGWLGDVSFSRAAQAAGFQLRFQPDAVVAHWHQHELGSFLRERYARGRVYGDLRTGWMRFRRAGALTLLVASVLPLRLARILALTAGQCRRAHCGRWYVPALPILVLGHIASLAGESLAYARAITHYSSNAQTPVKTAGG